MIPLWKFERNNMLWIVCYKSKNKSLYWGIFIVLSVNQSLCTNVNASTTTFKSTSELPIRECKVIGSGFHVLSEYLIETHSNLTQTIHSLWWVSAHVYYWVSPDSTYCKWLPWFQGRHCTICDWREKKQKQYLSLCLVLI